MSDARKRLEAVAADIAKYDNDVRLASALDGPLPLHPIDDRRSRQIAADLRALLAEGERMREALAKIADGSAPPIPHGHYLAHRHAVNVARVALGDPDQ